jgi:hypothetical protein
MAESDNKVVLCKAISETETQEPYVKTLESAGYKCNYLQTLQFEFVNISELQTCLSVPDKYTGTKIVVNKFLTLKWTCGIIGII